MTMKTFRLRIHHDHFTEGASAKLGPQRRVLYCVAGEATLSAAGRTTAVADDQGWFGDGEVSITVGAEGAVLWRWELVAPDADPGALRAQGVKSTGAGDYPLEVDTSVARLMRLDRVSFPLGGEALTHVHAAPGVRCQLTGNLLVESLGKRARHWPGDSWVEHGPDAVYARASAKYPSSFVRVMIIPAEYRGRSTITYVRPEDAGKPKSQTYKRYLEEAISL
jgi:hypothetical protein